MSHHNVLKNCTNILRKDDITTPHLPPVPGFVELSDLVPDGGEVRPLSRILPIKKLVHILPYFFFHNFTKEDIFTFTTVLKKDRAHRKSLTL